MMGEADAMPTVMDLRHAGAVIRSQWCFLNASGSVKSRQLSHYVAFGLQSQPIPVAQLASMQSMVKQTT